MVETHDEAYNLRARLSFDDAENWRLWYLGWGSGDIRTLCWIHRILSLHRRVTGDDQVLHNVGCLRHYYRHKYKHLPCRGHVFDHGNAIGHHILDHHHFDLHDVFDLDLHDEGGMVLLPLRLLNDTSVNKHDRT
jgi:hypothetical protein